MGSLERRLQRLEARSAPQEAEGASGRRRAFEHLFHAHEKHRRELDGLEPLLGREDDVREALEVEHEPVEHARPPWFSAVAWEERERLFRGLFAELDRLGEVKNRKETHK